MQQLLLQLAPPPAPTLDNCVPGRNGAALKALRDIARGAGAERFVYLWGEAGSGRTHLLRGLAQAAGERGTTGRPAPSARTLPQQQLVPIVMQQLLLQLASPPAPTLDNFVPGRNAAAVQALRDIAQGTAAEHFVYLWGEPGSGRSHLLRGLAQAARARKGLYLRAPSALNMGEDSVIAVDDVHSLSASEQGVLFDLLNRARTAGGALVTAGDAAPAQLALREDLRSRLSWGLAFQLHPLSDAEKAAALREHARARAIVLGADVIDYLLQHAPRDMTSLIGILDALDRYSLEHKRPITLALVRNALASMTDKPD